MELLLFVSVMNTELCTLPTQVKISTSGTRNMKLLPAYPITSFYAVSHMQHTGIPIITDHLSHTHTPTLPLT